MTMKIKTYSTYIQGDAKAESDAKSKEIAEQFHAEFQAMMAKYKATITVREGRGAYESWVEGIDVDFDGIYEDGEAVRPYFTIEYGSDMT